MENVQYVPDHGPGDWGIYKDGTKISDAISSDYRIDTSIFRRDIAQQSEFNIYIGLLILHYGHFIVDTLSRLWPLVSLDDRKPRIICHRLKAYPEDHQHDFLYDMLEAIGVKRADIISYDRETQIPALILPERSFHERSRVHSVFGDLCRKVGGTHWDPSSVDADTKPAYLSKTQITSGMMKLINEPELENELDRLGVEIMYPENLSFAKQIDMFARRKFVLGLNSSAFHTATFSAPGRRIVGLNWSFQLNANFPLFDTIGQNKSYYYWALGTNYSTIEKFNVGWTIPEPRRVANELLDSIENFDQLDERDRLRDIEALRGRSRLGLLFRGWRRRSSRHSDDDRQP